MIHRSIIISLTLLVAIGQCHAQIMHERNTGKLAAMYRETKADTNRVRVLLRWSTVLQILPARKTVHYDSSFLLANEAYHLSEVLKFEKGKEKSDLLKGKYFIKIHDSHSLDSLMNIVSSKVKTDLMIETIDTRLVNNATNIGDPDSIINKLNDATLLMESEKDFFTATSCKIEIAVVSFYLGKLEEGAQLLVDALNYARSHKCKEAEWYIFQFSNYLLFTENGKPLIEELMKFEKELELKFPSWKTADEIQEAQYELSAIVNIINMYYMHQGKVTEALDIELRTIKLFEANNGTVKVGILPDHIGRIFYRAEKYDLTLKYCLMAFNISKDRNEMINGDLFKFVIRAYVSLGRPSEGLAFLQKNVKIDDYLPVYKYPILSSYGDCYFALGNNVEAEKYYLESLQVAKSVSPLSEAISYFPLGKLYTKTKQYRKARFYLDGATTKIGVKMVPVWVQRDIQQLLFQVDSATGKYLSAIDHLNRFRVLNDSIFNIDRNRQIEEIKIQFENDKKDAELKSKEQNIELLTKQSELQHAELQQTKILRNSFIAGVVVLFVLLALTYNRYRLKQRTNRLLEEKQDKINLANDSLQHANQQLQRLLDEKEWLVKEIHHRVKNNLQIVVSLLNTQANHLDESEALVAIRESQQRMQVISLLHQRLYRMEDSRMVDMKTYIRELTGYISESYKTSRNIYLVIEADNIFLDISQAVSIGLILNEAITNSYKYAFTEKENGLINITLESLTQNSLMLRISDNGNGLPPEFSLKTRTSMGMRLIETLSDQLDGELKIESINGVIISIHFTPIRNELNLPADAMEIFT